MGIQAQDVDLAAEVGLDLSAPSREEMREIAAHHGVGDLYDHAVAAFSPRLGPGRTVISGITSRRRPGSVASAAA